MIRRASLDDAGSIEKIEEACFSVPWSAKSIEDELKSTGRLYLVIEDEEGQIVGYGGAWLVLDEGQITNIAILPEARRKGYGLMLTRKLVQELFKAGMTEIFLEVRSSNGAAQGLYRRLGFTVKGLRKRYYTDPVEDALIMSRIKDEFDEPEDGDSQPSTK